MQELLTRKSEKPTKKELSDADIDYSDIPALSDEQLAKFKRRGRPVLGDSPRRAISIRIEEKVLQRLKNKAKKTGVAYQSLINEILKKAV